MSSVKTMVIRDLKKVLKSQRTVTFLSKNNMHFDKTVELVQFGRKHNQCSFKLIKKQFDKICTNNKIGIIF